MFRSVIFAQYKISPVIEELAQLTTAIYDEKFQLKGENKGHPSVF
jgi:hypothetical protein